MITSETLANSVQINDGFKQSSADGANLAFDKKYGIMFWPICPVGKAAMENPVAE